MSSSSLKSSGVLASSGGAFCAGVLAVHLPNILTSSKQGNRVHIDTHVYNNAGYEALAGYLTAAFIHKVSVKQRCVYVCGHMRRIYITLYLVRNHAANSKMAIYPPAVRNPFPDCESLVHNENILVSAKMLPKALRTSRKNVFSSISLLNGVSAKYLRGKLTTGDGINVPLLGSTVISTNVGVRGLKSRLFTWDLTNASGS